jgi:hypothetical protein
MIVLQSLLRIKPLLKPKPALRSRQLRSRGSRIIPMQRFLDHHSSSQKNFCRSQTLHDSLINQLACNDLRRNNWRTRRSMRGLSRFATVVLGGELRGSERERQCSRPEKSCYPQRLFSAPLSRWPRAPLLLMLLEALTSNVMAANRRPSAVRRIVGSCAKAIGTARVGTWSSWSGAPA